MSDDPMTTCENCDGEGGFDYVATTWLDGGQRYVDGWVECPACGGSGWVYGDEPQQLTEDDLVERTEDLKQI
jgi:DnaJ-class molecular chaperone